MRGVTNQAKRYVIALLCNVSFRLVQKRNAFSLVFYVCILKRTKGSERSVSVSF